MGGTAAWILVLDDIFRSEKPLMASFQLTPHAAVPILSLCLLSEEVN